MVQVDVFWAYGWGASLAAAAGRPLLQREQPLESRYFVSTLLFLSLIWAPTGMLLLLRHPSWETMQAAAQLSSLSEWLILAFGITNVTQGILGFWVGQWLLRNGRQYLAQLNWIAGYFGMFFILLYGWDGLGYDRFLYDRDMLSGSPAWVPGVALRTAGGALPALWHFLHSSVAMTLYTDGVYLLPPFFWLTTRWRTEAALAEGATVPPPAAVRIATYLGGALGVGLGSAAVCALAVRSVAYLLGITDHVARGNGQAPQQLAAHIGSYFIGLPLGIAILWFTVLRPRGPVQRLLAPIMAPKRR
jgi:hypothetical protein